MGNRRKVVLVCVLVAAGMTDAAGAEEVPVIESVNISQNRYVAADTLLYYVSTRTGDRFDEIRLRNDFRRLWDTGFLEDLVLDVKDGASGKIVTFLVRERPRILAVDYRGNKTLSTTAIQDALKEKDAALGVDTFYEPSRVKRVEKMVRDLLAEKGLPFARVTHEARAYGGGGVQVSFTVDEGIKARVRSVSFSGNTRFSDGDLRGVLKNLDRGPFWKLGWLKGPPVFSTDKWSDDEGDESRLRTFLLDRGYVDAIVGEPVLRYSDGKSGRIRKRPVKWVDVEIPVMEGEQYRVGTVSFEGMTVFDPVRVRPLFKLETGEVYRESRLRKGYETLRELYGARGYFQWTGQTRRAPDPVRKTVDVVLAMEEDIQYYVGRILFTGNSQTRDKVIRREVYLNESEIFNTEALKLSIRRLNQLGYFKPLEGPPKIEPSTLGADHIDVTFAVEEQNRNQFTFGGGVSGLEGAYLNAGFQTANFLGLGETVGVTVQAGGRSAVYQLGITEPYLFDRPITAGVDVFSRRIDYVAQDNSLGWSEARAGASFTAGLPLGRFTKFFSGYTYEVIDTAVRDDLLDSDDAVSTGEPVFNPRRDEGRAIESRLTPTFVRNTVDNPFTPRSGMRLTASSALAGGFLGGSVDYIRPEIEGVLFWPVKKRMALGVRGNAGYILPFGSTAMVPYYQRFFLGGENQIRGVNPRTVSPVSENGQALGGNKFMLFNAEYYFDIAGPLRFLLFFDAGEAYAEGQSLNGRTMRSSTGAELRFVMPILNVPFRLIYALNPIRDVFQPASTFKFAVGTTF